MPKWGKVEANEIRFINVEATLINENWIPYDIQNSVELFFHLGNDKLFRITTLYNYKGKLFEKIGVLTQLNSVGDKNSY